MSVEKLLADLAQAIAEVKAAKEAKGDEGQMVALYGMLFYTRVRQALRLMMQEWVKQALGRMLSGKPPKSSWMSCTNRPKNGAARLVYRRTGTTTLYAYC